MFTDLTGPNVDRLRKLVFCADHAFAHCTASATKFELHSYAAMLHAHRKSRSRMYDMHLAAAKCFISTDWVIGPGNSAEKKLFEA